ncbi:hypothetical protein F5887DRAFT_1077408 [Amanita rubescens]|nr:hypothetical protein F5887DRAFT_1077408 [Amanita rubescens]
MATLFDIILNLFTNRNSDHASHSRLTERADSSAPVAESSPEIVPTESGAARPSVIASATLVYIPLIQHATPSPAVGSPTQILAPTSATGQHIASPSATSVSLSETAISYRRSLFTSDSSDDGSSSNSTVAPSSTDGTLNLFNADFFYYPIEGLNRHELFEAVCDETLHAWEAATGPKVIVFIANDSVTKDVHHRVTLIRKALTTIFPDADPIIGSAEPSATVGIATYAPVFPFLIHRIPELYARYLTEQRCWTISNFTFFVMDFALIATSYVMTLAGLHLPKRPESDAMVASLVRQWLLSSNSVISFIRRQYNNWPMFMIEEQIEFTISTVDVIGVKLGGGDDSPVVFNVYIDPPTIDPLRHQEWLKVVQAVIYFADCGTGKAAPIFYCDICKARDHSADSCIFPANQPITAGVSWPLQ